MTLRVRGAMTALAVFLVSGSLLLAYTGTTVTGPWLLLREQRFHILVAFGGPPFWLFIAMLAGLALLFAAWAATKASRLALSGAFVLFVMWGLQVTREAGLYYAGLADEGTFWVREARFIFTNWGLALFVSAIVLVVVLDRVWGARENGASGLPGQPREGGVE